MYGSYLVTVGRCVSLSSLISVDVSILTYVSIVANAINCSSNISKLFPVEIVFHTEHLYFSVLSQCRLCEFRRTLSIICVHVTSDCTVCLVHCTRRVCINGAKGLLASTHDHLYYRVCPDILSLVADLPSGNGCGSPNHI